MLAKLKTSTTFFQKIKGAIVGLCFFIPLVVSIIVVNFLQLCTVPVLFISPTLFRRMHWGFGYFWWACVVYCMEKIRKVDVIFSGDMTPLKENVVLIANHQEMVDVPAILSFAIRKKRLGQLKWFAKDILKYVPGAGWGLYLSGHFFVKRDWLKDQKRIDRVFAKALRHKEPIWVVSFLEGTRITPEKLKLSQEFCRERNRPILENLLAPRTKGFEATIQSLRTNLDAVYDITIGFHDGIPTLTDLFCGHVRKFNIHVRRFPIQSIPLTEKEIGEWVWKLFEEKDALLKYFHTHHSFPGPTISDPL